MAVVRKEVSDRTFFGQLIKLIFIGFNVLMLIVMLFSCSSMGDTVNSAAAGSDYPDAARAGATIGAGLAAGALLFIWLAGAVILGLFVLFTRRKKIVDVEE